MKNHILIKSLILSFVIGMSCFFSFKGHATDLNNVQTIGQKNRNQAVGRGLQIADSGLCKGPFEADSAVKCPGLVPDVSAINIIGINGSNCLAISPCGCILHMRDSISSSQILNSFSSPIAILAAPGTGLFYKIISVAYNYHYATAAYTISGNSGLFEGSLVSPVFDAYNILTNSGGNNSSYQTSSNNTGAITSFSNQPIIFYSGTSNPTTGGGYLIVYIDYIIEQF